MIQVIFLDIDGTLIDGADGPFPEDIAAIEAARDAGRAVFLSTGRSIASLPPALRDAPWVDGVIAGCGATVCFQGKMIYRKSVPPDLLPAICGLYLRNGKWCVFEGETNVFAMGRCPLFDYGEQPVLIGGADDFPRKYPHEIITKITMEGFLAPQERAVFEPAMRVCEFAVYSEAIVAGESKRKGMDRALAALGLTREEAAAIGDSENDIDIVGAAGLGIAMENACDSLKAVAKAVTGKVGEGGVAQAIEQYVLKS
ncbi:MAG: Cof-type HAD-IIB family hydrolase [Spirochaetaceae bacterium]|nr:Cof-type HAD-IIB family hydrolase [Spirochaetaceae bacterium]